MAIDVRAPCSSTRSTAVADRGRRRPPRRSGSVMYSGRQRCDDRPGSCAGVATVTSPAPDRSAPTPRQVRRAGLSARAGDDQHVAVVALVAVRRPRRDQLAHRRSRQQLDARAVERLDDAGGNADVGDHDVAGPVLGRRQHERQLRRAERDGQRRLDRRRRSARSHRPTAPTAGRSPRPECPTRSRRRPPSPCSPVSGAFRPVPKIASTISVQLLTSEKCSSHAWPSAISTTVRPSGRESRGWRARRRARRRHGRSGTPRRRRRAAAACARRRSRRRRCCRGRRAPPTRRCEQVVVHRFDRRHDLPAGVLHQHERRDADLVDRAPIGFAHLRGVQDSHPWSSLRGRAE